MTTETIHQPPTTAKSRSGAQTVLDVTGMTCGNCARHVTTALQNVPGVRSASVNLEGQQATVKWSDSAAANPGALLEAVQAEGYGATLAEDRTTEHAEHGLSGWRLNLLLGVPVTAVLMLGEWAFGMAEQPWFQWLGFALATLVQVFAGARFYRGAWGQLKAGSSNMDTLVALGSTTAYVYSVWALFTGHGGHVYFMEAAAIITLISIGHWVESRVSVRASSALRKLLDLAPATARRRLPDGTESVVPVAELQLNDVVLLKPGDRVPTDGEVASGESAVDESMLTGESLPVDKKTGNLLYAGTANLSGQMQMRVTATGEETALAHIVGAVQRAQTSRAEIQRLGDRVSNVFVPVVVAVALGAGLWWGLAPGSAAAVHHWLAPFLWPGHPPAGSLAAGFIIAAAVLIIACPCAMGLATPAAIMAGSNAAAQRGILIRDGVALEKAGRISAVLFDKTGTLTAGKPSVAAIWSSPVAEPGTSLPADKLKRVQWAAGLARNSHHPISQAIATLANGDVPISEWREVHGAGVQGTTQSGTARLGSLRWLGEQKVDMSPSASFSQEWLNQGATLVGFAIENQLLLLFAVKDTVKPGAGDVVKRLDRQNLRVFLVTGDNAITAGSIARQCGIMPERVFAEVRPEDKAGFVKKLQSQGERVAFVGDGINDAPALEQADLGVAVSRASDIAREAADIILLNSEIEAVPESLGLARATLRTIKQNLFWAFFYNMVGIPLAALGFMSPVLCAAAMGLSDLIVIGNALRLKRWRLPAP